MKKPKPIKRKRFLVIGVGMRTTYADAGTGKIFYKSKGRRVYLRLEGGYKCSRSSMKDASYLTSLATLSQKRRLDEKRKIVHDDSSLSWGNATSKVYAGALPRKLIATLSLGYQITAYDMDYRYNHIASFSVKKPDGTRKFYTVSPTQHRTKGAAWKRLRRVQKSFDRHMMAGKSLSSWKPPKK